MWPRIRNMELKRSDHDLVTWLISVFVFTVLSTDLFVECMVIRENPVRLRVLEYSSKNGSLAKVLNSRYSDLVVGEEVEESSQLVLECSSRFGPLRWIYNGVGHPDHKSYYTSRTRADSTSSFTAYLSFPNGLTPKDTGQYSCQNSYNSSLSNFVYLFVPKKNLNGKPSLFVPNDKRKDVVISAGQTTAKIPCGVVHPNVKVSLERVSQNGKSFWLEPPTPVPYNPKSGFTVPVSPTTKEIYTCRGELNGNFEEVTFVTSPLQPRIDPEVELLHDVLHHNQHRHRLPTKFTNQTQTIAVATTATSSNSTSLTTHHQSLSTSATTPTRHSSRPKLPVPEPNLVSACSPQFCGSNAECIVKDYKPYCVCLEDYTGDPKTSCHKISDHSQHLRVEDPCHPSPCGKNSECLQINGHPLCTCVEGYYGSPPKCSPHKFHNCTKNYDCEWTEYCNTETRRCEDICEGSVKFCGKNALCTAFSHMPYCTCPPGGSYVGDPYDTEGTGCQLQSEKAQAEGKPSCNPSPCGMNAHCKVYSSYPLPICFCPQGFTGDPSHRCYKLSPAPIIDVFRPHYNTHPPLHTTSTTTTPIPTFSPLISTNFLPPSAASTSLLQHLYPNSRQPVTLCTPEFCGENARCRFRNNHPECHCLSGYKGDPYKACHRQAISPVALRQACSVCGPNSVCSMISSDVRCICAPDTLGAPPNCRRLTPHPSVSSTSSSSSSLSSSSHSQQNHQVSVVSTSSHFPSISSTPAIAHHLHQQIKHKLQSLHNQFSSFSSQSTHSLQNFHPACTSDLDCPDELVCYTAKQKCLNPCSWACSDSAVCFVANHHVQCRCPPGFKGDPRIQCVRPPQRRPLPTPAPNQPSQPEGDQQQTVPENHPCRLTCGPHTVCRRVPPYEMRFLRKKALSMESLEMEQDPLQRALLIQIKRLIDDDDGDGGSNFKDNYFTECMCMKGAVGNAYSIEGCSFKLNNSSSVNNSFNENKIYFDDLEPSPSSVSSSVVIHNADPCRSSSGSSGGNGPCGPHSLCVPHKGQAFCRCDYDSVGEPPNCRLRCGNDQHCLFDQICEEGRCIVGKDDEEMEIIKDNQQVHFDGNFLK